MGGNPGGRLAFGASPGRVMFLDCGGGSFYGEGGAMSLPGGGSDEGIRRKRPFFASSEELFLFDDDYYDEQQLPEKKRRLTPDQVRMLERSFEEENKLEPERKAELARKLGLQPRQVAVWFQNRRARWKTKQLERDYDRLKSAFDALRSDHDALLADNHRLRSQVTALTEKLQPIHGSAALDASAVETEPKPSAAAAPIDDVALPLKVEDWLSPCGSGGSAVLDGESVAAAAVLDSSVESYFQEVEYSNCMAGVDDEGAGSDEGCSYYGSAIVADAIFAGDGRRAEQENEDDQLEWWMWS